MAYDQLLLLDDLGISFSAKADSTVSGGDLVRWTSGTNVVGSVLSTFNGASEISVAKASGTAGEHVENVLGIALNNAASGGFLAVATKGYFILPAGSNGVSGGLPVTFVGYANCVEKVSTGSVALTEYPIGRALSTAADEANFAIVSLNL